MGRLLRFATTLTAAAACATASAAALVLVPTGAAVALAGGTAAAGAGAWAVLQGCAPRSAPPGPRAPSWAWAAGASCVLTLSLVGSGLVAGAAGVAVLVVVVLAVPEHALLLLGWLRPDVPVVTTAPIPSASMAAMDAAELCAVWRRTGEAVRTEGDPGRLEDLVETRRRCLEEFERRDLDGFDGWLTAHASPTTDPRTHLHLGATPDDA